MARFIKPLEVLRLLTISDPLVNKMVFIIWRRKAGNAQHFLGFCVTIVKAMDHTAIKHQYCTLEVQNVETSRLSCMLNQFCIY